MSKETRNALDASKKAGLKHYADSNMHLVIEHLDNHKYLVLLNGEDISDHVMTIKFGNGGLIDRSSIPYVQIQFLYDSVELIGWSGEAFIVKPRSLG